MHPVLKKVIIALSIILALALITASVIAYLNEDRIRSLVVSQINNLLETDAQVESIEFSLLQKFPKASIRFKNVKLKERSNTKEQGYLLEASSVFLEFDPFDLISGNYVINEIQIDNSTIHITYFEDGSNNFDIFRKDSTNASFQISLQHVTLTNARVIYEHRQRREDFTAILHKLKMTGNFSEQEFALTVETYGMMESFQLQAFRLKHAYDFETDVILKVNRNNSSLAFERAGLQLGKIDLSLTGTYIYEEDNSSINLSYHSKKCDLEALYDFIPADWKDNATAYDLKGNVDLEGVIKGKTGGKKPPYIEMQISLVKGSMKYEKSGLQINDLSFKGSFSNGEHRQLQSSTFKVDTIYFESNVGVCNGKFLIADFDRPMLSLEAMITIDLAKLKPLIKNDSLEQLEGTMKLNLYGKSPLDSLNKRSKANLKTMQMSGKVDLENVTFRWTGMSSAISNLNTSLFFERNFLTVNALTCDMNNSIIAARGKVQNLLPYLFYDDEKLKIAADLESNEIIADKMMGEGGKQSSSSGLSAFFSDRIESQLRIKLGKLTYHKFEATNIQLELKIKHPFIALQDVSFNAFEGLVSGWVQIERESKENYNLNTMLHLDGIDVHRLFYQCENFGQTAILAENLKGKANLELDFSTLLKSDFSIIKERVHASTKLEILNGELIGYQPAMALSKYVDIEELKHIKFSRLVNEIEIINEVVYIPEMEVKSSALELKLSGKHSFNNEIEYHFQLWLNDFLFRKSKRSRKNQTEFGEVETDESGRAKLFIRMEGTVENYTVKLDRKAMRKVWNENMKEERDELGRIFREEFKGEKKEKKTAPGNFQIEWDDGGTKTEADSSSGEKQDNRPIEDKEPKKEKWFDKIGKPIKDEYQEYDPEKFD